MNDFLNQHSVSLTNEEVESISFDSVLDKIKRIENKFKDPMREQLLGVDQDNSETPPLGAIVAIVKRFISVS